MNSEEIAAEIEKSITELAKEYGKNPWSFLTENDVTNKLYSILVKRFDSRIITIHSELRPFYSESEGEYFTIMERKDPHWDRQRKANDGSMVDLVLVDAGKQFLKEVFSKAKWDQKVKTELRYWRMLSYPVKAWKAAIEIKIRVSGNLSRIRKDIEKLARIGVKNSECRLYLIVLDCKSKPENLEDVRRFASGRRVVVRDHLSIR